MTMTKDIITVQRDLACASEKAKALLARAKGLCAPARTAKNIGTIVDATASRKKHWGQTLSETLNVFQQFHEGRIGAMKLVYYAGNKVFAGKWHTNVGAFVESAAKIMPVGGETQIEKSIGIFTNGHVENPIGSLILIADSCEDKFENVVLAAQKVGALGARLYILDDGERSENRSDDTAHKFQAMADISGGVYATFDPANMHVLKECFALIGAEATGDKKTMQTTLASVRSTEAKILGQRILALPHLAP